MRKVSALSGCTTRYSARLLSELDRKPAQFRLLHPDRPAYDMMERGLSGRAFSFWARLLTEVDRKPAQFRLLHPE